jgi:hydrogenase nickel incorporation protein HypB
MCGNCGCGDKAAAITNLQTGKTIAAHHHHDHNHQHAHDHGGGHHHDHDHDHDHGHHHSNGHAHPEVALEARLMAKNDAQADKNRAWFAGREILALNLVSSPGSGKTALLERTIKDLSAEILISVVEGDQATVKDAERIRAVGAPAVQVNTGAGCHLDAEMISRAMAELRPPAGSVLFIENVGNLVCPALFDLGERAKVVILSVTEGEDKPLKYPHMFQAAELMVINKIDLLPHVDFDLDAVVGYARQINPAIAVTMLSVRSGEGLADWYGWVRGLAAEAREPAIGLSG